MEKFTSITGTVLEAQRFINPRTTWGRPPAHPERRELWVRVTLGEDRKFIIHSQWFAARKGHRVVLLMHASEVVGLYNLSNQETINYTRTDPVGVWRARDLLLGIGVGVWAGVVEWRTFGGFAAGALAWCLLVLKRAGMRWHLQSCVDRTLNALQEDVQGGQP